MFFTSIKLAKRPKSKVSSSLNKNKDRILTSSKKKTGSYMVSYSRNRSHFRLINKSQGLLLGDLSS